MNKEKITDQLLGQISLIQPISEQLQQKLEKSLRYHSLNEKTVLLQPSYVCDHLWFIGEGLARAYYLKEDRDITSWFMSEQDFILSVHSFFNRKPSYEYIELVENTTLVSINYSTLQEIYIEFPEFNYVGRVLTEHYYGLSEERLRQIRMQTAHERYEALAQNHPWLLKRVPLKHIASYLGLTPETVSRLRAKR